MAKSKLDKIKEKLKDPGEVAAAVDDPEKKFKLKTNKSAEELAKLDAQNITIEQDPEQAESEISEEKTDKKPKKSKSKKRGSIHAYFNLDVRRCKARIYEFKMLDKYLDWVEKNSAEHSIKSTILNDLIRRGINDMEKELKNADVNVNPDYSQDI